MAQKSLQDNLDVDYVITYKVKPDEKQKALERFQDLIQLLATVDLATEVRARDDSSLFVFVKAKNNQNFADVVYRSRIRDWLHGVRQIQPIRDTVETLTDVPLTEAERLRLIHNMITAQQTDGGAGITPGHGDWKNVEAIFPLHNHERNREWMKDFTSKTFLTPQDLDHLRDCVGEKIAYYYAFLQSYFQFLIFPAAFGFAVWVLLGNFSPMYLVGNGLWCVIFVEYWKRQERDLAIRWGVKNVGSIQLKRREFRPQYTAKDPITGEEMAIFPAKERLKRQTLQIPLAFVSILALGSIIITCFGIEIFIGEIYTGPFKQYLVFTPTIILTLCIPVVSSYLTKYAEALTNYENYDTQDAHDKALVSKLFVLNFITSYLGIILTSFVYVPFATLLVPYLDVFSLTVRPFANKTSETLPPPPSKFTINPQRLPNQMFFFAVTSQLISFATETIVPIIQRKGTEKVSSFSTRAAQALGSTSHPHTTHDLDEEHAFLKRIREESSLPPYDVQSDLREMCIQFGYLALFSVVWPLTPVSYLINNWVELRGDTFKMCNESRRPVPERADSIGPWLNSLEFLAWLGSITSAALVYMFSDGGMGPDGRPSLIKLGLLMITVFASEHTYLLVRLIVRTVISKVDSGMQQKERSERFMVRRQFLKEAGLQEAVSPLDKPGKSALEDESGSGISGEKLNMGVTRQDLEEEARAGSLHDSTEASRFWSRQRGWRESVGVGRNLIEMMEGKEVKKAQ